MLNKSLLCNCLLGAIILCFIFKTTNLKIHIRKNRFPHFYVIDPKTNIKWHFTIIKDLLPSPLYFVLFIGQFKTIK